MNSTRNLYLQVDDIIRFEEKGVELSWGKNAEMKRGAPEIKMLTMGGAWATVAWPWTVGN